MPVAAQTPDIYARQDEATDPADLIALYRDLPRDPSVLRDIVSNLIVHVSWVTHYQISPDTPKPRDTQPVRDRLHLLQSIAAKPLHKNRLPDQRTFGTCRDYSLMLCSFLRYHAISARVRCGFATYFNSGPYEDHWICEYRLSANGRWIHADAQLDQMHRDKLNIGFDAADLPAGAFVTSPQAWLLARSGTPPPDSFGHDSARGLWFLRVNLIRDLLSLTNRQTSVWDDWRKSTGPACVVSEAETEHCDRLAHAVLATENNPRGFDRLVELASDWQRPPWQ